MEATFARLWAASGSDPRLSFTVGLTLAGLAQYKDAERFFFRALEMVPANFDILYNLGRAAYHARDLERAHDVLQTAFAQRPQDVDTSTIWPASTST